MKQVRTDVYVKYDKESSAEIRLITSVIYVFRKTEK